MANEAAIVIEAIRMAARRSRPFPAALHFLLCPVGAYFNPTPPEAAILLGVRFSPFREVTPLFPNQEASYERTRTVIGSHSEGRTVRIRSMDCRLVHCDGRDGLLACSLAGKYHHVKFFLHDA